jgi:serine protease
VPRAQFGSARRAALAVIVSFAVAGSACSRTYPPRNTQSDLVAFSRIDKAWAHATGAGATVAVIDWQFDPRSSAAPKVVFPTSMVPGEKIGGLKPWHGAWMVEIVHRVAPDARIIPIIGRSLAQPGYQDALVRGIRYAAEHGATAVTSSMGPTEQTDALREAIDFAEQRGTVFVDVHPENVAARGEKPKACAPAACDARILRTGIVSVPEHPARPHPSRDVYTWPYDLSAQFEDGWGYSNAPPIVAGVIALVKSANPRLSAGEIRRAITETAYDREGFRVLDAEAAVTRALRSSR